MTHFTSLLPASLLLLIFTNSPYAAALAFPQQQQPQIPLFSIASFDSNSNFALDTACSSIYRRSIPSCQPSDFSNVNPCSPTCVQSLNMIQAEAQAACASQGGIPTNSFLAFFRNGTGVDQLCTANKGDGDSTDGSQGSPTTGRGGTSTLPPGAGGVSTATEVAADTSKATSMDLGNGGVVAVIVIVIAGSVLLLLASLFYYNKYYKRKGPPKASR
jgi:hypothetical protein